MILLAQILTALVGFIHFYFMYLEMVLWTTPRGRKIFGTTAAQAKDSAVLAANQGLYNGLLGVGLYVSLFLPWTEAALGIRFFCLGYIVIVGAYGAMTVSPRIFWIQSLPAVLALAATAAR